MKMAKYDPMTDLTKRVSDLGKFWQETWDWPKLFEGTTVDMYEEGGNLIVEANLPAFNKDEIVVNTQPDSLEIVAEHKEKAEEKDKKHYLYKESSNHFWRRIPLPEGAKPDNTKASFESGMLKVMMPITAKQLPKKVTIK
jgi:HSP20 family protein